MENNSLNEKQGQNKDLYLVDGSGYIFRAYYALPQNLTNPSGKPVGAVLGFTNMLFKLIRDLNAPYLAVIFDAARRNFRYDLYPEYKANREETPEDLVPQFPLFREATMAFGVPALEVEGFEADDIIAAYVEKARSEGRSVTIVGSDKDLMQLVGDDVRLYDPIKGKYIGVPEVFKKFGVLPEKVVDVQALAGDSIDNVPGVPGIGIKTAAQLISEFGSLESLLNQSHIIPQPKRRESLQTHAQSAILSKKLVTLDKSAPLPLPIEELKAKGTSSPALSTFLKEQGFRSILSRIGENPDPANQGLSEGNKNNLQQTSTTSESSLPLGPAVSCSPIDLDAYVTLCDLQALDTWLKDAQETGLLAVDTETTGLTPALARLVGVSLATRAGRAAYIPLTHGDDRQGDLLSSPTERPEQIPLAQAMALLKTYLEDPSILKVGHNLKYDYQMFAKEGVFISPFDDTMLLSYVLDGTSHPHSMDSLAERYLSHKTVKFEDVTGKGKTQICFSQVPLDAATRYAAEDADVTLRLHTLLKPRLVAEKMCAVYEDLERPLIPVIADMERAGIKVDPEALRRMSHEFSMKLSALETQIHGMAGTSFNLASPKQIGEILFERMGLSGGTKTKTGQWSTDVDVLEDLAGQGHEIVTKILEWRGLSKLKSTYTDSLQNQADPKTGRIHTSFSMAGTSTGRLSSSDPNLQNIPIRTEEGKRIREAFVAEDGHVLLSVDYSQIELRLIADMADVKALKTAFREGVDIHALTASQVFGIPIEQVTPDLRRQAKAVNFGIIYGISGWGLAKQLSVSAGEASAFIRRYLSTFPEIQSYMERIKAQAHENGFVKTKLGRKCMIPNINASNPGWRAGAERQAINAPLQGTAADLIKIAMIRIPPALQSAGLHGRLLLQVHDELILEIPEQELSQTQALVCEIMEHCITLDVPLIAEAGSGKNWGVLK